MAKTAVKQLRWLKENRLAAVQDLLSQRGLLLSSDVRALLARIGPRGMLEAPWRLDAARQIGAAFGRSGPPTLVIKGVSLAWRGQWSTGMGRANEAPAYLSQRVAVWHVGDVL